MSKREDGTLSFTVDAGSSGQRIDKFLTSRIENTSRSYVQNIIGRDKVKVNGKVVNKHYRLAENDRVTIEGFKEGGPYTEVTPQKINLRVVYEDQYLLVISKKSGVLTHPVPGFSKDTIVNALLYHYDKLSNLSGKDRAGIVHRLDKDTSGLLIVAKNDETHAEFATLFKKRRINKTYLTLLHGEIEPSEGTIKAPIARSKKGQLMKVSSDGKMAVTKYKVLKFIDGLSYVEVKLITGRTHQIRVHFSKMGYAVVGDEHYSSAKQQKFAKENDVTRLFLHCSELKFKLKGESYNFKAPLPNDLETVLTAFSEK